MLALSILFVVWFFVYAKICSCDQKKYVCARTEFYGFQYGHLFFYTLAGLLYPNDAKYWLTMGVVWEIFEYWLSCNPELVRKFGGCLARYDGQDEGPLWFRKVYGGKPKYENFIDRAFGIKNSTEHTWHYSIGENVTNVIGFLIGSYLLQPGSNR